MQTKSMTPPSEPLVSVIMPVYNVRQYIEQAVSSVLAQTFSDFELLIIDDQTPDDSIEVVQHLIDSDSRIRVVAQENRGLAGARNTGIRESRGTFLAFLDSDDFWHAQKLEKHLQLFESQPNAGVTFSSSMFVNEQGEPLDKIQSPFIKKDYTARAVFCRNPIGNGSAPVIRKSVFQQIAFKGKDKHANEQSYWQFFDEALKQSEDIDCWTRIALITATEFHLIDEPLTFYRINNEGLSADVEMQYKTWLTFIDKLHAISPQFVEQHTPAAKAFQCRYIARRCVSQAQGKQALKWLIRAFKHSPFALFTETKRTLATVAACLVFACLPESGQKKLVKSFL